MKLSKEQGASRDGESCSAGTRDGVALGVIDLLEGAQMVMENGEAPPVAVALSYLAGNPWARPLISVTCRYHRLPSPASGETLFLAYRTHSVDFDERTSLWKLSNGRPTPNHRQPARPEPEPPGRISITMPSTRLTYVRNPPCFRDGMDSGRRAMHGTMD